MRKLQDVKKENQRKVNHALRSYENELRFVGVFYIVTTTICAFIIWCIFGGLCYHFVHVLVDSLLYVVNCERNNIVDRVEFVALRLSFYVYVWFTIYDRVEEYFRGRSNLVAIDDKYINPIIEIRKQNREVDEECERKMKEWDGDPRNSIERMWDRLIQFLSASSV